MKVAICFSGAIRNFDDCICSTLKYFINNFNNPDIFLHMWTFNQDDTTKDITYNFKWRKDNSSVEKIMSILNPKKYVIEEYTNDSEKKIIELSHVDMKKFLTDQEKNYGFNCCSMYWKILKSFELAEEYSIQNKFEYDLIIRARLDFIWEDYIGISHFTNLTENNLFLIKDRYATCSKLLTNDKFFAGNYNVMKKMCGIFYNLKKYQDDGYSIEGQTINEIHIKHMNLKVNWIGHSKTYYKFMGRHKIILKNKIVLVQMNDFFNLQNININFLNEIIYKLLDNGFDVINLSDNIKNYNKINNKFHNQLNLQYNIFIKIDSNSILIFKEKNNKEMIISSELMNSIEKNHYLIIDFILSLLENYDSIIIDKFEFNNYEQINNIESGEIVKYKYLDHGYYNCNYIKYDNNNHIIMFDKKNIKSSRDLFKINNLVKYYKNYILPTN